MEKKTASAIMLTLLLTSMLTLAFNIQPVKASGTIYIRADGSVEGTDKIHRDGDVYTFTDNIYDEIRVERSNVIIDGAGYTLQGSGSGYGFTLSGTNNVTIKNTNIKSFYYGIKLNSASFNIIFENIVTWQGIGGISLDEYSSYNSISKNNVKNNPFGIGLGASSNTVSLNTITDNGDGVILSGVNNSVFENNITNNAGGILIDESLYFNNISENYITNNIDRGVWVYKSSNCTISRNNVANNGDGIRISESSNNAISENNVANNGYGIKLSYSSNNMLRNNSITNNECNFGLWGENLADFVNDVDVSNTIEGKPIYYWINEQERAIPPDASYVALVNCTHMIVQSLNLNNNGQGILLAYTTHSTITKNNITSNEYGIELYWSSNNTITGSNITNNQHGIYLSKSFNNNVSENHITNNDWGGIELYSSANNSIFGNNIKNNYEGVILNNSFNNTVSRNNVANNQYGIYLEESSDNTIYHNNFKNNTKQVYDLSWDYPQYYFPSINVWDDGYPSGGNYWSDYAGVDFYSGPYQNETGSDGIGDTPYVIDADNVDHYPLMNPYGTPPLSTYSLTITATVGGTTDPAPGTYTYTVNSTVQVTAIPAANYLFDYWELDSINVGSVNPYTVLMDKNHTLKAVFSPIPPPLSASINPLSASLLVGQSVTFTSTVSGGYTPYSYQWYLNGNPVSGATSASWTFTQTTSGIYYAYLKVTDAKANTAQSDTARITFPPPLPVGGYSVPIQVQTKAEPIIPYIALIATLTIIFTKFRPKTKRKR